MDAAQIRTAVLEIVKSIAPELDAGSIDDAQPLRRQLDLDSMDWLNVMVGLHDKLGIDIPESDHGRLTTLAAIVDYVASKETPSETAPPRVVPGYPANLIRRHWRLDGRQVTVRPIRADDAPMEADFVRHLSSQSRYLRFMATLLELPEGKLKYLTDIDYEHHMALVATTVEAGREVEIGVARYIVDADGRGCEFAIVVDDAWQGSGLAGALMADLMAAARAKGLTEMSGIVLATNHPMLKFARQLGFTLHRDADEPDTVHVVRKL